MDGAGPTTEAPHDAARALALLHATSVQRATGLPCVGWRAVAVAAQALAGLCGVDSASGEGWYDTPRGDDASAVEACRGWLDAAARREWGDDLLLAMALARLANRGLDDVAPRALAGVA